MLKILIAFLLVSTSYANKLNFDNNLVDFKSLGDDRDNGGDGIILKDGSIILRELSYKQDQIFIGKEIYNIVPDYSHLVEKIGKIHPKLARKLLNTTRKLRFVFLERPLPELKLKDTSFEKPKGQVIQLAIHRENKFVFLYKNAFERLRDPEFLILHEVLHSLVSRFTSNSKQLNHLQVRGLTNFIYHNIDKNLSKRDLVKAIRKYQIVFFKKGINKYD